MLTRTKFLAYMKERWARSDDLQQALLKECPLLGLINKKSVGGKYYHVPLLQTGAQGRSATYATAVANAAGSQTVGFDVTYVSNYAIVKINGDTVNDCKNNDNALYDAIDHEVKAGIVNLTKDLRMGLYGNHGGARGQVGTYTGGETHFHLSNPEDSINFEVEMVLESSATDGTSGAKRSGDEAITAIDRQTGVITAAQAWDTGITSFAANDYIFEAGDFGLKMSGLLSWVPESAPGATAFFGVNRSVDTMRLGGIRYNGTGMPLETAMLNAVAEAQLYGAQISHFFCNPLKWAQVATSIGADRENRVQIVNGSTTREARIGYQAIMIPTGQGFKPLLADPGCQRKYIMGLQLDTWDFVYTTDDLVDIVDEDNQRIRRGSGDDWQADLKNRGNLACRAPGKNVRIQVES